MTAPGAEKRMSLFEQFRLGLPQELPALSGPSALVRRQGAPDSFR